MSKKLNNKGDQSERTLLTKDINVFKDELSKRMEQGQQLLNKEIKNTYELESLKTDFYDWNDYNSEFLKASFNNPKNEYRHRYDNCDAFLGLMDYSTGQYSPNDPQYQLKDLKRKIEAKMSNLRQLLAKSDLILTNKTSTENNEIDNKRNKNVFIIHGHDERSLLELESLLKDDFKLNPFILKKLPNIGSPTIIEKFEFYADQCSMAIALFTPDDIIEKDGKQYLQARPNVIYELGWFSAKLTRKNIILILKEGTDIFSDFQGILQIRFKNEIVEKYRDLMLEFKAKNLIY